MLAADLPGNVPHPPGGVASPVPASRPRMNKRAAKRNRKRAKQQAKQDAKQLKRQLKQDAKRAKQDAKQLKRQTMIHPGHDSAATPAPGTRTRRQMPRAARRFLFVVVGIVVLAGSVAGFWFTSDAFDERAPILVAARDIADGEALSAADLTSALLVLSDEVPHEPWSDGAPFVYEGMVATQPIPAGSLVRFDMVRDPDSGAEGSELEVVVPLDLSLATQGVSDGDVVLLVDPGREPDEAGEGRPRRVARTFTLANLDGNRMRLFLPPEDWAEWEALLERVGGTLMVVPLGDGGDPDELAQRLDSVWHDQWSADAGAIAAARAAADAADAAEATPQPGPGELEVLVSFDTSLVPTGFAEGDLVLVVDPGAEPRRGDPGRPRMVIGSLRLENYAGGRIRMFVPPEEWLYWRSLPDELGAAPMVLPVPDGTDVSDMSIRLNVRWQEAWQQAAAGLEGN